MLKFLHAADLHLDSSFGALSAQQAAQRRRESREVPARLSNYVNQHGIRLVLLAGDLFDSAAAFRDTVESLAAALGSMDAQVFLAPGNHDWYGSGSPYLSVNWPENVHIFSESTLQAAELPGENVTIHGAAFTSPQQDDSLLKDFTAQQDGRIHIGLLHGEVDPAEAHYDPIRHEEIAASGLSYLALGHIHKRQTPQKFGSTLCAWPGCTHGRGFDELGEKGFYEGVIADDGAVQVTFVPFARRRYEILTVDVTGKEPLAAIEEALPAETANHLYRIQLTGETDERGIRPDALMQALADRFYALEIHDNTRMAEDVWARADEDSLRGLFLRNLQEQLRTASTDEEKRAIALAARFGLTALDHRDFG